MDREILTGIGMTGNEAEVYLILLQLGEAPASVIAHRTNISRPHVYDSLNKLIEKGLAGHVIKAGRKQFRPADPNKLMDYLKEREESVKAQEEKVEQAIPELVNLYTPKKPKTTVEIYEGKEGIKTVLADIIRVCKQSTNPFIGIGETGLLLKNIVPQALKKYLHERKKYGIKARFLTPSGQPHLEVPGSVYKTMPKEYSSPSMTIVYGDKVTVWLLHEEIPIIVMMKSPAVAESYRSHFEVMWGQETVAYRGREGLKAILWDILNHKEYVAIGSGRDFSETMGKDYYEFQKEKEKRGIKSRIIASTDVVNETYIKRAFGTFRFLPEPSQPTTTFIYGNKIALCIFSKEEPIGFVIERKELADAYRQHFEVMWGQEARVYTGLHSIRSYFDYLHSDVLKPGMQCMVIGSKFAYTSPNAKFFLEFHKKRIAIGATLKMIFPEELRSTVGKTFEKLPLTQVRYIAYASPASMAIYKDEVFSVVGALDACFVIKNTVMADSYRKFFEIMWASAKP